MFATSSLFHSFYEKIHCLSGEFQDKFHEKTDIACIAKRWVRYRFFKWNLSWISPINYNSYFWVGTWLPCSRPVTHRILMKLQLQNHFAKSMCLGSPNKGLNCEGKILAYKKNKLCRFSILYIKNINKECFIWVSKSWIINEFLKNEQCSPEAVLVFFLKSS